MSSPTSRTGTVASRTVRVEGVTLHHLTAGRGAPLILLHGYTQTSRMWKPVMPRLAETFMVIAPTCPGSAVREYPRPAWT